MIDLPWWVSSDKRYGGKNIAVVPSTSSNSAEPTSGISGDIPLAGGNGGASIGATLAVLRFLKWGSSYC
jgi:hypothetical protein